MVDAFGCIVFTAPLVNFFLTSLTVCVLFLLGSVDAFGWEFVLFFTVL